MKRILGILVAAAAIVASQPAAARHYHHARHWRHHHHYPARRAVEAPEDVEPWGLFAGAADVVAAARSQLGNGAIYGRRSLWCARFMNAMLQRTGHHGTGSDLAKSFARFPHTVLGVGTIAVMGRRGGGHVGIVSGITRNGDPIIISGNNGHRVREAPVSRSRVITYVVPQ